MEAKCDLCAFFGEKPHCHNCKVINKTRSHAPQEIECSLEELVEYIENNCDITDKYNVGDYKTIELYTGEKVKMILLDTNADLLSDGQTRARTTFGVMNATGAFAMHPIDTGNTLNYEGSEMRNVRMEAFYRILPEALRKAVKPVIKSTGTGREANLIHTTEKCFLFSESEILGVNTVSAPGEGNQYEYFTFEINRGFQNNIWIRSMCTNRYYEGRFCVLTNGHISMPSPTNAYNVAFGFCI